MHVVTLDPAERALVELDGRRFVLLTPEPGVSYLVNAVCPHRGGPLHLGQLEGGAAMVRCPWHGRRIALRHLKLEALPLIRWRDRAVAVVPAGAVTSEAAAAPWVRRCAELCGQR